MSIVIGYLPTAEGTAALDHAIELARSRGTDLIVINSSRRSSDAPDMSTLKARLNGLEHTILQPIGDNDPAEQVLDAAKAHRAELVVIGIRRRTPVGKMFMGSTAQRILLEAECPVLAVKALST